MRPPALAVAVCCACLASRPAQLLQARDVAVARPSLLFVVFISLCICHSLPYVIFVLAEAVIGLGADAVKRLPIPITPSRKYFAFPICERYRFRDMSACLDMLKGR